jgi:hypothetical protein
VIKLLVARPKHSKELLMNSTIQKSWRIKVLRSAEVNKYRVGAGRVHRH